MKKSFKNILLIHSSNDLYGASKILILIVEVLIKSGYSVHLILPHKGPLNYHKSLKKVNISIINIGVFRKKYFNFFGLINIFFLIIKSTFQIKKIINKNNIDLVYTNTSTVISPTFAACFLKIPSIFHVHEIPFGSKIYVRFLINIFNRFSAKIIAVSASTREFWITKGVDKDKIIVVHNGFDYNFSLIKKLCDKKIVFTCISRIIPYKGHIFLIELFREILKKRNDIELHVVGDTLPYYNKYFKKLKSTVSNYNLEQKIIFLGFRNDVRTLLKKSNYLIHTPITPDPLPTVIFEAIETNTPVIFTNNGGAKEILDDCKNGLKIDSTNIEKSAQLILDYIKDINLQSNNTKDSIKFITKKFNKKIFSKKLKSLISNL